MAKIVILNGNEVKELSLQGMNLVIQREAEASVYVSALA